MAQQLLTSYHHLRTEGQNQYKKVVHLKTLDEILSPVVAIYSVATKTHLPDPSVYFLFPVVRKDQFVSQLS